MLSSPGDDDVPIDKPVEALLLSSEDLDGEWSTASTDEAGCRAFSRQREDYRTDLTSCAEVLADVAAATDVYETWLDQSRKLTGSLTDAEPDVGVEAAVVRGGADFDVIFRDANAVGEIAYGVHGTLQSGQFPSTSDVVRYAVLMHRRWRD